MRDESGIEFRSAHTGHTEYIELCRIGPHSYTKVVDNLVCTTFRYWFHNICNSASGTAMGSGIMERSQTPLKTLLVRAASSLGTRRQTKVRRGAKHPAARAPFWWRYRGTSTPRLDPCRPKDPWQRGRNYGGTQPSLLRPRLDHRDDLPATTRQARRYLSQSIPLGTRGE